MSRRIRFVSGLLALVALTFSFSGSVWASTCGMPMMEVGVEDGGERSAPPGAHCGSHGDLASEAGQSHEGPRCPFGSPVAAQACAGGVASAPAATVSLLAPFEDGIPEAFDLRPFSDLLLDSTLFRPPRA